MDLDGYGHLSGRLVTRTFRLREEIEQVLEEKAANRGISVSVYLDNIIRKQLNSQGKTVPLVGAQRE
jgi:predicted HicB family RNase H-like nuclease